ncbi:polysaccharide biosynthesis/export family protein [Acidobacterium sp. S8]|uniref:polysaccharide biosynthesis/export family protein n=1 Tax=Acidobacterium sp. S8 TaxID=1641854 RepID=UPI00131CE9B3|nr:polysaccharide biosynthesis/export family protein [Acidobacterium sp. S8]
MIKKLCLFMLIASQLYVARTQLLTRDQPYRIQPSDQLQLSYRYTPEYDESLTIQPDGVTTVKLVGSVKIGGLTLEEARTSILAQLNTRLNQPEISLTLSNFVKPSYTVVGQVSSPGKFEMHGTISAIDAIAMAGGFKDSAKHSQVILFRRADGDTASTRILNIKKLMNPKHPELDEDVMLKPGDLLVVPKNTVSKISDYVHWVSVGTYFPLY